LHSVARIAGEADDDPLLLFYCLAHGIPPPIVRTPSARPARSRAIAGSSRRYANICS
jgi:hypothetical protein